ncbi:MAG TPA: FUSC family protein [Pinirhizobacter sp.]|uniref:FUSC family protein n=1 Tax=Pinirhizobacter sp. TaxID=2950432 RepID=UPI002CCEB6E4|nr:FUSC family protein [Pinirhizobacter sp.]HMH68531.1 FUSC family protein [Pinirhizobacter sp.]
MTSGFSLPRSVLQSLTTTRRPDVPMRVALRNAAAVAIPLAIGVATGHVGVGIGIAAGALDTMFSDQPGPYQQRLQRLFLAALAAGGAALLGFLVGGHPLSLSLATAVLGFLGGMLVIFGPDIARVGMTSMLLLVITAATPLPVGQAIGASLLIFGGGILLTLFSIAAWPLQRYRPERHALAEVYRGLAMLAAQPPGHGSEAPALSEAMTNLQQTLLGRFHARGRAMEAFRVLLDIAERIRLELITMQELGWDGSLPRMIRADAARVLRGVARALDEAGPPTRAQAALKTLQASEQALFGETERSFASTHVHALSGQLAAAVRNANWAGSRGEIRAETAESSLPAPLRSGSALAAMRANMIPQSIAFRHAVRCAVVLTLAVAISRYAHLPHGYWLPMTAAIVLRPDFGATLNFGLLRVVGTVLGLVLTTLVLRFTPDAPWAHIAVLAILCVAFRYLATAHYGIAVAALTGTVVILLSFDGVESAAAMTDRVLNTVLGSAMALVAYVLWPSWERTRARAALADMFDAYAAYLATLAGPAPPRERRDARTLSRTARTNAQASLDRMRSEPATPVHLMEMAQTLFANGNRLARTAMTLEAMVDDMGDMNRDLVGPLVRESSGALHALADALRHSQPPGSLPDLRSRQREIVTALAGGRGTGMADQMATITDRLVDNVNTINHILQRR